MTGGYFCIGSLYFIPPVTVYTQFSEVRKDWHGHGIHWHENNSGFVIVVWNFLDLF